MPRSHLTDNNMRPRFPRHRDDDRCDGVTASMNVRLSSLIWLHLRRTQVVYFHRYPSSAMPHADAVDNGIPLPQDVENRQSSCTQ